MTMGYINGQDIEYDNDYPMIEINGKLIGYKLKYPILPKMTGEYDPSRIYSYNEYVTLFYSTFKSKKNNNNTAPASYDITSYKINFNPENWEIIHDNTNLYITEQEDIRIQNQINNIISNNSFIDIYVEPYIVFKNEYTKVSIRSNVESIGEIEKDSHTIKRNGSIIAKNSSYGLYVDDYISSSDDQTYTANVTINGKTKSVSATVKVVDYIYYGCGKNPSDAKNIVQNPQETPERKYIIQVTEDLSYIYFDIPENMSINSVTLNGIEIPMKLLDISPRHNHKCYQSINTYDRDVTLEIYVK